MFNRLSIKINTKINVHKTYPCEQRMIVWWNVCTKWFSISICFTAFLFFFASSSLLLLLFWWDRQTDRRVTCLANSLANVLSKRAHCICNPLLVSPQSCVKPSLAPSSACQSMVEEPWPYGRPWGFRCLGEVDWELDGESQAGTRCYGALATGMNGSALSPRANPFLRPGEGRKCCANLKCLTFVQNQKYPEI